MIININELKQRTTTGDPSHGQQRFGSRVLATPEAISQSELSLELNRLFRERSRRGEVTLAHVNYRGIIVASVLAALTVTLTSWGVSGCSPHITPTLIVVAALVSAWLAQPCCMDFDDRASPARSLTRSSRGLRLTA